MNDSIIATLFQYLFDTLWQSAVLAAIVSIVVFTLGRHLKPGWCYLLWSVVLLRLVIPVLPGSPWGIWYVNTPQAVVQSQNNVQISAPRVDLTLPEQFTQHESTSIQSKHSPTVAAAQTKPRLKPFDIRLLLSGIWVCGVVVFLARIAIGEVRLMRKSLRWTVINDPEMLALLKKCRREIGLRRPVKMMVAEGKIGAASCGVIRGTVLFTEESLQITTPQQLRLILLHELTHLKRFDPLMQRFSLIVRAIHWFNPVAWFVVSRLQRTRELACDAAVLQLVGTAKRKEYGLILLRFTELFSSTERLPGLVGIFHSNGAARRIEMVTQFKKTRWSHFILGTALVAFLAAFGLTKSQSQTQQAAAAPVTKNRTPDDFTISEIVQSMPEKTDFEKLQKIESLAFEGYSSGALNPVGKKSREKLSNEEIEHRRNLFDNERLRLARAIELPELRAYVVLKIALETYDNWDKYKEIVGSLDSPYKEMGLAYATAYEQKKSGNLDAAKQTLWEFVPPLGETKYSLQQQACGHFCFIALGRLGFTNEIIDYLKNAIESNYPEMEKPDDLDPRVEIYVSNQLSYAISDVGHYLLTHGKEPIKAFDFALDLYVFDNGNPGYIMNAAISQLTDEDRLDEAIELTKIIETKLGKQTQWETYPIFQALLKKGGDENYEKALQLTRNVKSFNAIAQKQMYYDIMEYLLKNGDKERCTKILDEAIEQSTKIKEPENRLSYFKLYAKIVKQLNDPGKTALVLETSRKFLDAVLKQENLNSDQTSYDYNSVERTKSHSLCEFALVQNELGNVEAAKKTFEEAKEQAMKISTTGNDQRAYCFHGIADTLAEAGFVEDAFATAKSIQNKSVQTEAYWRIGLSFINAKDKPNALLALAEAEKGLKEINDARIVGLVNGLKSLIDNM